MDQVVKEAEFQWVFNFYLEICWTDSFVQFIYCSCRFKDTEEMKSMSDHSPILATIKIHANDNKFWTEKCFPTQIEIYVGIPIIILQCFTRQDYLWETFINCWWGLISFRTWWIRENVVELVSSLRSKGLCAERWMLKKLLYISTSSEVLVKPKSGSQEMHLLVWRPCISLGVKTQSHPDQFRKWRLYWKWLLT